MSAKNTIIVIKGPSGHEYVATVGRTAVITSKLDEALPMSKEEAERMCKNLDRPAEAHDLDWYRVEVGRTRDVNVRLENELSSVLE